MTHTVDTTDLSIRSQEDFTRLVQERLREAVRLALIDILEEEVTAFIGAKPYERSVERQDQRNGHYTRDLETTVGLIADLPVPRTRTGDLEVTIQSDKDFERAKELLLRSYESS